MSNDESWMDKACRYRENPGRPPGVAQLNVPNPAKSTVDLEYAMAVIAAGSGNHTVRIASPEGFYCAISRRDPCSEPRVDPVLELAYLIQRAGALQPPIDTRSVGPYYRTIRDNFLHQQAAAVEAMNSAMVQLKALRYDEEHADGDR